MNRIDTMAMGLEQIAVDRKTLASNFLDVIPNCDIVGLDAKTELQNKYALYLWLINTALSRRVRSLVNGGNNACILYKDTDGYRLKIPGTFWSEDIESSAEECCWPPFDFAKCENDVPINRLCLKDCDSLDDEMMGNILRLANGYEPIAAKGTKYNDVKKKIARLSMAFLTAMNVILGTDTATTNMLKPFHGLLQLMLNPAVETISGANLLSAFDEVWCRIVFLGGNYIFAVNPIIYQSILAAIQPGQFGTYPDGWNKNGDVVTFHGIGFLQDPHVPVDVSAGTGDIWVLDGEAVGAWMATDLMPADAFIKYSGFKEETLANGCGSSCWYYYNYGTTFNNNANKIMVISDVEITAACTSVLSDLGALIQPTTLIPDIV